MSNVRLAAVLILALAGVSASFAQTIEVSLLESVQPPAGTVTRQSEFVISGALDALFEAGRIGTNVRPVAGDAVAFGQYVPDSDAAEAMIDYVVVILAEYDGRNPVPSCRYRLIRVRDGRDVTSGAVPATMPASAADKDVEKACVDVGAAVIVACFAAR